MRIDCEDREICVNGYCQNDPCYDGIKSEGESDVDCGHVCANSCDDGKACVEDSDCFHHACEKGICVNREADCKAVVPGMLLISEILNNAQGNQKFDKLKTNQQEFIEIVNVSNDKLALSSILVQCVRTDDGSNKTLTMPLSGCLDPKGTLLLTNKAMPVPNGVVSVQAFTAANQLTNTADYTCSLVVSRQNGTDLEVIHEVTIAGGSSAGVSDVLEPLNYSASAVALAPHTTYAEEKHSPGYCTNGALYINDCKSTCDNGLLDGDEIDTDCGGRLCKACKVGQACEDDTDCEMKNCQNGTCGKQSCAGNPEICPEGTVCDEATGECISCQDGLMNGTETDVDCGGDTCDACQDGSACLADADCKSFSCEGGLCKALAVASTPAAAGDIVIAEVFNYASGSRDMSMFDPNSKQKQVEFIELVNLRDHAVSLDGLKIRIERTDKNAAPIDVDLRGHIMPNQAMVVSGTPIAGLPDGVGNLIALAESNALTNTAVYQYSLVSGETALHTVTDDAPSKSGKSKTMPALEYTAKSDLVDHTVVNASLNQSPGYCANGALYVDHCELTCENEKFDLGETDVDCGGVCLPCDLDKTCVEDTDCESKNCASGKCAPAKCESDEDCKDAACDKKSGVCGDCGNQLQDGDETDVDCGGKFCGKCEKDKACEEASDCLTDECTGGKCTGTINPTATPANILINEFMAAEDTTQSSTSFFTINGEKIKECKFIEAINVSSGKLTLDGCSLVVKRTDTEKPLNQTPLNGTLPVNGVIVAHACAAETLPLPEGTLEFKLSTTNIAQSGTYEVYVLCGETEGTHLISAKATKGTSMNLVKDLDSSDPNLIPHTSVQGSVAVASPGYCANGGLFSEGCKTHCENSIKDEDETDVNCGGALCDKCAIGKKCVNASDCESDYCNDSKVCAVKGCTADKDCDGYCHQTACYSCEDNAKNGDETDVDCGGTHCGKCEEGKSCKQNEDCDTGKCGTSGKCEKTTVVSSVDPNLLVINEIFDSGSRSPEFELNGKQKACEFIEIANPTNSAITLDGITLELRKKDDSTKNIAIPLSGTLPQKNLLIINNCKTTTETELGLPNDAVSFPYNKDKMLTGTWTYDIALVTSTKESIQIKDLKINSIVNSSYNRSVDFSKDSEMDKTTTLMSEHPQAFKYFASPGYCANGALFSEDCKTHCENSVKDADETDVNCGGELCAKCTNGKNCLANADCSSDKCVGGVCAENQQNHCENNTQDADESDVDCGGADCSKCENGKKCLTNADCSSNICDGSICVESLNHCENSVKDVDESDVDCGGADCAKCANGKKCLANADCSSGKCEDTVCVENSSESGSLDSLVINEVMGSPATSSKFEMPGMTDANQCEFVEIVNLENKALSLDGIKLNIAKGTEKNDSPDKTANLSGNVPAKGVIVVNNCSSPLPLPANAVSATLPGSAITNTQANYTFWLSNSSDSGASVTIGKQQSGESENRQTDASNTASMVRHSTIDETGYKSSPGYCANGKLFSADCK